LENLSHEEVAAAGRRSFDLPEFGSKPAMVVSHLLAKDDWLVILLTLYYIFRHRLHDVDMGTIEGLTKSDNEHIREMAQSIIGSHHPEHLQKVHQEERTLSIPERILQLRSVQILEGLTISELATVALRTEEVVLESGRTVMAEGERGNRMYLIVEGKVSVRRRGQEGRALDFGALGVGDYFGEMALFDDSVRSATIQTVERSRFLVLGKAALEEAMEEYPEIAINTCKTFSLRMRKLQEKLG
jgi:hypothetical protein